MLKKMRLKDFKIHQFFYHISLLYIYMMAVNILIAAIFFAIGKSMNWYFLPLSFCISIAILCFFYDDIIDKKFIYEILVAIAILLVCIYFAGKFYDTSWDGNAYHKLAIGLLKNHWNPLYNTPDGNVSLDILGIENTGSGLWVEAYCKATWFLGASIYFLTGNIETGKAYTIIGMICVFFITFYFLRKKRKRMHFCLLFSLAAMLNPIAVQQIDSFYIDGFLQSMLYILVVALYMNITEKNKKKLKTSASLIAASMIICGNIKFTGLLYGGIFCIVYFLWYCVKEAHNKEIYWVKKCIKRGMAYAVLAFVTIFWAGSSSYLTNFINHGTFTYPLTGKNPVDIMSANSPFEDTNHFKNLFISLFSEMDNLKVTSNRVPTLKVPFTLNWESESAMLDLPDARISGFGFFFSGLLIIAIILILIKLLRMKKNADFYLLLINVLVCIALSIGITESWWARYAPYIYFILLMGLYIILDAKKIYAYAIGTLMAVIVCVNGAIFLYSLPEEMKFSKQVFSQIKELNNYKLIDVYTTSFSGLYFNLKDLGVYYSVNENLANDDTAIALGYLDIKYKIQE